MLSPGSLPSVSPFDHPKKRPVENLPLDSLHTYSWSLLSVTCPSALGKVEESPSPESFTSSNKVENGWACRAGA